MHKELAYRENDGIAVTLFWHSDSNRLSVSVYDWRNGDWFELWVLGPIARRSVGF